MCFQCPRLRGVALAGKQSLDRKAPLQWSLVVTDAEQRRVRRKLERALLRGEDRDVLADHMVALPMKLRRRFGVVASEVVRDGPEIIRRARGLRRDRVADDEFPALLATSFTRAGARLRRAVSDHERAWRREVGDLPAIDIAVVAAELRVRHRRRDVKRPAAG